MTRTVAVVGGGLAGISAALRCVDAGYDVTLLEAKGWLGGLTTSFRRGDLDVDNGQHVFLRCCTSYRELLRRLGVEHQVALQDRLDMRVVMPSRSVSGRLRRTGLPAPLHLAGSLLRYRPLDPPDRLRAVAGALALRRLDRSAAGVDDQAFGDWLARHGQNDRTVEALWELFTVATLNTRCADASLSLAAMVFQTGLFAETSAGDIGWALVPLKRLHGDSAERSLRTTGADVRLKAKVDLLTPRDGGWLVGERGGHSREVDGVVLAVPPRQAQRLLPPGCLDVPDGWAAGLGSSPIVNAHVVFDRAVMDEPFVAGVGTPLQWVFDRTAQAGLDRGQYVAVSVSAAAGVVDASTAEVREQILPALREMFPAARTARVEDFFVTRERDATFLAGPGTARLRPGPVTRLPGLFLAGAWTATGWPATMESAVRSGEAAAEALRRSAPGKEEKGSMAA